MSISFLKCLKNYLDSNKKAKPKYKDDSEISKMKVKKSKERFTEGIEIKQKSKDDFYVNFKSAFNKISELETKINYPIKLSEEIKKLAENKNLNDYVDFLKKMKLTLNSGDPAVELTNQLIDTVRTFDDKNQSTKKLKQVTNAMANLLRKEVN